MQPTYCGSWVYEIEDVQLSKNLPWCNWCDYLNHGLFTLDLTVYEMNVNDAAGFDVGNYEISIPIRIPNSDVLEHIEFTLTVAYCQVEEFISTTPALGVP